MSQGHNYMDIKQMKLQNPTNTASNWAELNPILLEGEMGFESDSGLFKLGDGIHHWNDLPYSKSAANIIFAGDGINITGSAISAQLLYTIINTNGE